MTSWWIGGTEHRSTRTPYRTASQRSRNPSVSLTFGSTICALGSLLRCLKPESESEGGERGTRTLARGAHTMKYIEGYLVDEGRQCEARHQDGESLQESPDRYRETVPVSRP